MTATHAWAEHEQGIPSTDWQSGLPPVPPKYATMQSPDGDGWYEFRLGKEQVRVQVTPVEHFEGETVTFSAVKLTVIGTQPENILRALEQSDIIPSESEKDVELQALSRRSPLNTILVLEATIGRHETKDKIEYFFERLAQLDVETNDKLVFPKRNNASENPEIFTPRHVAEKYVDTILKKFGSEEFKADPLAEEQAVSGAEVHLAQFLSIPADSQQRTRIEDFTNAVGYQSILLLERSLADVSTPVINTPEQGKAIFAATFLFMEQWLPKFESLLQYRIQVAGENLK